MPRTFVRQSLCAALLALLAASCSTSPTNDQPAVNGPNNGGNSNGSGGGAGVLQPNTFPIRVARHVDQPLSGDFVDEVFSTATELLNRVDFECPDVGCPVTFSRSGPITTFDLGSSILTTEGQLDEVFDIDADIKVVTAMVGVCGIPANDNMTIVLGCAFTSGSVVIVSDADPDVWAHEWGHVQGLPHRDTCPRNLMHSFELRTNAIIRSECDAFLSPTPRRGFFLRVADAISADLAPLELRRIDSETPQSWLTRIVERRYRTGLPATLIRDDLPADSAANLARTLQDSLSPEYRGNVLRAMGLSGDPASCGILLDRVSATRGPIQTAEFHETAETILALGRLAGQDATGGTLTWLMAATDPLFWTQQQLAMQMPDGPQQPLEEVMARLSIMALGISGSPLARTHLEHLRARMDAGEVFPDWFQEQVAEALTRLDGNHQLMRVGERALRVQ